MLLDFVYLIGGGVAVWLGAEGMVRGAVKLAAYLGVPSLLIGLTVVAFGTSAPELVVSVLAAIRGHSQMALGNVIGSNIINVGLVLGISVVLSPIAVSLGVLKRDIAVVVFSTFAVVLMAWLGSGIGRVDGVILLIGFIVNIFMSYKFAVKEQLRVTTQPGWNRPKLELRYIAFLIGGMVALALGAEGMVDGAVGIADSFGVSKRIIGLTIVAFGTSVPELAASVVAAKNGEGDLAFGNIVGSNLYNILLVLGATSLISPIACQLTWLSVDFIFFVLFVVILLPMIRFGWRLGRLDGMILLALYAGFNVLLFW
jgi:cation:H+ antiporter